MHMVCIDIVSQNRKIADSSELRHGPSIFLLKREGGSLSLNALDIDK